MKVFHEYFALIIKNKCLGLVLQNYYRKIYIMRIPQKFSPAKLSPFMVCQIVHNDKHFVIVIASMYTVSGECTLALGSKIIGIVSLKLTFQQCSTKPDKIYQMFHKTAEL